MAGNEKLIRIIGDQPWKKATSPEFHFEEYASTLAEIALSPKNETPLCVLVQGEWGVGKSTLLKTIQSDLGREENKGEGKRIVKTVWFNAWKYKDAAPVMAGLLGALLEQIGHGRDDDWKKQLQELIARHKGRIGKAILFALPAILDKKLTDGMFKDLIDSCSSPVDEVLEHCDPIDTFQQAFLEVASAWLSDDIIRDKSHTIIDDKKHCLSIFIDDLDRCDDDQIKAVLEAIKLFLDFPGVCFYLAMDQHQLDSYLKGIFKERSKDALDKFVQVVFDIPTPPKEDFQIYVDKLIDGHPIGEFLQMKDREMLAINLPANPRATKRYLNDLAVWFSIFGKVNKVLTNKDRDTLMPFAGRYHLLAHAIQKQDRAKWNAMSGSAEVLLSWFRELKEISEERGEVEKNIDSQIANSGRLIEIINWMLNEENNPEENLNLIVGFRQRMQEPITPLAPDTGINPIEWVRIPGMNFEMCAYPVTQRLYQEVMGENPSKFASAQNLDNPVENVNWHDVNRFCNKLNRKSIKEKAEEIINSQNEDEIHFDDRNTIRLPTVSEWQYSCSAALGGKYYGELNEIAWYLENSDGSTKPVGQKKPNSLGLYDMIGNVWEWCSDKSEITNHARIILGGSWNTSETILFNLERATSSEFQKSPDTGFRIVREI